MPRGVIGLRGSESERQAWELAAHRADLKLSAWLRRAANNQSDLESALDGEALMKSAAGLSDQANWDVEGVKAKIYPQSRKKCIHRLTSGTFCKKCGVTK